MGGVPGTVNGTTGVVYASTACLPGTQPLPDRLADYREAGITAIELGAGVTVDAAALAGLARMDPPFLVHNYFPPPAVPFVLNLASSDVETRNRSLALVMDGLALAARLGAPFYSVHAGFVTDPVGFGTTSFLFPSPASDAEIAGALERFTGSLTAAAKRARELDVAILVENNVCPPDLRGKLLLQTAGEFLALFAGLPSPELPIGILLDTGHLNVTACTFGFNPTSFIEAVEPYVRCLHVHDNDGSADTHLPVEPGSWVIDVLRRPAFAGLPVVVESRYAAVEDLRRSHTQLTSVLA